MPLSPGSRLGPYEILSPLGAGGMGEVYRARDTRLAREVAVKVISPHLAGDPDSLARFEREARAIAALSHPNILTIYDFGRAGEISFTVSELLEGESLRVRLAHSELSWRKAVDVGIAVADALAAAHSRGIIHRDLKPENVFLTSDGRTKVLDFGLARWKSALPQNGSQAPTEVPTDPGVVLGTVGYMSPEQIRGEPADAPSDVFSLGCILFEAIAGRRAFSGHTPGETMAAILRDEVSDLADIVSDVPPELARIVRHCLEKDPNERYQSVRDLAFDLRAVLSASVASKASSGKSRRAVESLAVLPLANASGDPETEYLSDGISEELINSLSRLPDLRVMARSTVFRYKGRGVDPLEAGRELRVRAVLAGRVLSRGDSLVVKAEVVDLADGSQLWAGHYYRRLSDIASVEEEIAKEISESLRPRLTGEEKERLSRRYTESGEAYRLYLKGRFYWNKRTTEGVHRGLDCFRQALEADPEYALAYVGLADSYHILGYYAVVPPSEAFPKAKAAATRALAIDAALAEARTSLAYAMQWYDWDWPGAEREYQQSIALEPNYATAHHWFGIFLMTMGRFKEAFSELHRAQALDPLSMVISSALGWAYYYARDYDAAVAQIRKALEMDPTFLLARWWLGIAYEQKSMEREALEEIQHAVRLSGDSALLLSALGQAQATFGRRTEAVKLIERLREMSAHGYVSSYHVAAIHAALGDRDAAFESLERAFQERSNFLSFLKVDPQLDPLREDPRFADLVRRVGLPF